MKKKFRVTWSEVDLCTMEVYAKSSYDAVEIASKEIVSGLASPDQREFGGYEHWECEEVKED